MQPLEFRPVVKFGWFNLACCVFVAIVMSAFTFFPEKPIITYNSDSWLFGGIWWVLLAALIFGWWIAPYCIYLRILLYEDHIESRRLLLKDKVIAFCDVESMSAQNQDVSFPVFSLSLCYLILKTANTKGNFAIPQKDLEGQAGKICRFLMLVVMANIIKRIQTGEKICHNGQVFLSADAITVEREATETALKYCEISEVCLSSVNAYVFVLKLIPKSETMKSQIQLRISHPKFDPYVAFFGLYSRGLLPETIQQIVDAILFAANHSRDPQAALRLACILDENEIFEDQALYQYERAVELSPNDEALKRHLELALQRRQDACL